MILHEGVEVAALHIDLATELREGDEAAVTVGLPGLLTNTKLLASLIGLDPLVGGFASDNHVLGMLQIIKSRENLFPNNLGNHNHR